MSQKKQINPLNVVLADEDINDCFFFAKAFKNIPILTQLATVQDGEELVKYLSKSNCTL